MCTKTQSPKIGTVLHWQPPDVHIFHTDPSLVQMCSTYHIYFFQNVVLMLITQNQYKNLPNIVTTVLFKLSISLNFGDVSVIYCNINSLCLGTNGSVKSVS